MPEKKNDSNSRQQQARTREIATTRALQPCDEGQETQANEDQPQSNPPLLHDSEGTTTIGAKALTMFTAGAKVEDYDVVLSKKRTLLDTTGTILWRDIRHDITREQYDTEGRDAISARLIHEFAQYVGHRYKNKKQDLERPPRFWVPFDPNKLDAREQHVRATWQRSQVGIASLETIGEHIYEYLQEQELKLPPATRARAIQHRNPAAAGDETTTVSKTTKLVQKYDVVLTGDNIDAEQSSCTPGTSLWREIRHLVVDEQYRTKHGGNLIQQLIIELQRRVCLHSLRKDRKPRPSVLNFWVKFDPNKVDVNASNVRAFWQDMKLGIASRETIGNHVSEYVSEYVQRLLPKSPPGKTTITILVEKYDVVLCDHQVPPRQEGTKLWRNVRRGAVGKPHSKNRIQELTEQLINDFEQAVLEHSVTKKHEPKLRPPVPYFWVKYDPKKVDAKRENVRSYWGHSNLERGIASQETLGCHISEYLRKQGKVPIPLPPPNAADGAAGVAARSSSSHRGSAIEQMQTNIPIGQAQEEVFEPPAVSQSPPKASSKQPPKSWKRPPSKTTAPSQSQSSKRRRAFGLARHCKRCFAYTSSSSCSEDTTSSSEEGEQEGEEQDVTNTKLIAKARDPNLHSEVDRGEVRNESGETLGAGGSIDDSNHRPHGAPPVARERIVSLAKQLIRQHEIKKAQVEALKRHVHHLFDLLRGRPEQAEEELYKREERKAQKICALLGTPLVTFTKSYLLERSKVREC